MEIIKNGKPAAPSGRQPEPDGTTPMIEWIKKICGSSNPPGGNKEQNRFFLASWAVLAFIGFFIPEDIITQHAWAREFTDFMASIVPQIDRVTALNLRPEVNRFHYSVLWAVSPVYFIIIISVVNRDLRLGYIRIRRGWVSPTVLFAIVIIAFSLFLWPSTFFHSQDPGNRLHRLAFELSPFRDLFAPIVVGGYIIGVGMIFAIIKGFVTGQLIILKEEEGGTDGKR